MKRLTRLAGAAVMAASTLAIAPMTASPAGAATHCTQPKWDVHPDKISTGTFQWGNGTHIRTAGYTDCTSVGQGYPGQGIDVHCSRVNDNGLEWVVQVRRRLHVG
jgi:hypothetical protein